MNKKGQGISVNVIIIAAIALIVLVVLIAIFTGRLGLFSRGISEAASCDQACKARGYEDGGAWVDSDTGDTLPGIRNERDQYCQCVKPA